MSDAKQWTPIQEGRFHLRSMRLHESLAAYVSRAFTKEKRMHLKRIKPLVGMAQQEKNLAELMKP